MFKNFIRSTLRRINIGITKYSTLEDLRINAKASKDIDFLLSMPEEHSAALVKLIRDSKSQIRQDLFVLSSHNFKKDGFFVEFGATNGIDFSNTYLLEKRFSWKGILAEPATCWHSELKRHRSVTIDHNCIWSESNRKMQFNETEIAELSTLSQYSASDFHHDLRKVGKKYDVTTLALNDLLAKYEAPRVIDYLSIDTEGSELEILNSVDFNRYSFKVITCEHNYTENRNKIYDLLTNKGYERKHKDVSFFDDWYVKVD